MTSRRRLLGFQAVVGLLLLGIGLRASDAQEVVPTRVGFNWRMESRFGLDSDGDGRIEIENTHEYLYNRAPGSCSGQCPAPQFLVRLRAVPAAVDLGVATDLFSYEWRIGGPAGNGTYFRIGPDLTLLLPEGDHDVDLRVRVRVPYGSVTLRSRGSMAVDDLLVVALGDSYPSGEGSPDVARDGETALWADASDAAVEASHALAHRSSVGWPVRTALSLEIGDPHTSVTFVDLAASGARIDTGILGERRTLGIPAQLDELRAIVGSRPIDLVLLQVGGNDIGFSLVVRDLVDADPLMDPLCYDEMVENVWESVRDGRWDRRVRLTYHPPIRISCERTGGVSGGLPGLDGLPAAFDRLAAGLEGFAIERVALVEYPDPTGSATPDQICDEIVGDATSPFGFHEVDEEEQQLARERVLGPLNQTMRDEATRHGWLFVGGIAEAFAQHGYCAPWPDYGYPNVFDDAPLIFKDRLGYPAGWYRPPSVYGGPMLLNRGAVSWYRTASQSAALQGPAPRFLTSGTMHPNELGHLAMSRIVYTALQQRDD